MFPKVAQKLLIIRATFVRKSVAKNLFIYIMTKMRHFRVRLAGFMNLIFFVGYQIANTNAKSAKEPLQKSPNLVTLELTDNLQFLKLTCHCHLHSKKKKEVVSVII